MSHHLYVIYTPSSALTCVQVKYIVEEARRGGVQGHRAEIFAVRAAKASAALSQREEVEKTDLQRAVQLVILPRATITPPPEDEEEQPPPPPPPPPPQDQQEEQDQDVRPPPSPPNTPPPISHTSPALSKHLFLKLYTVRPWSE